MSIKNNFPTIRPSLNLDFANSKQVDPRITFTRASTATYWDGKTFAKAEENLILYSQDADNAAWGKANVTITANSGIAPDGSATADEVVEDASAAAHIIQVPYTSPGTVQQTFSVYIKPQGRTKLRVDWANLDAYQVTFDFVGAGSVFSQGGSISRAAITQSAGGFYRCEMVFTPSSGVSAIRIKATDSVGIDGVAFAVWGAQLEQRSQATAYTPTTSVPITKYQPVLQTAASDVPRIDHDPVTGECKGLLIEWQRTNLLTYSEQFDNAVWDKLEATITANAIAAPSGSIATDLVIPTASNATHGVRQGFSSTATSLVMSAYVKAGGYNRVQLYMYNGSGYGHVTFDLVSATVTHTVSGSVTWVSGTISSVGNGWFRITMFGSGSTAITLGGVLVLDAAGNGFSLGPAFAGDGTSGIYIWGAQIEAGAFATSYIPTTTAQVTRAADAASMAGTNFSSWYRQDEGTVVSECADTIVNGGSVNLSDGTVNNRITYFANQSNSFAYIVTAGGVGQVTLQGIARDAYPTFSKLALAYKQADFAAAGKGAVSSSSVGVVPSTINRLTIGVAPGHIKRIAYYPKRLSNAELQALTA